MNDKHINHLPKLLALASKLEGMGQYNNAKLARVGAEAIARRAAYQHSSSIETAQIGDRLQAAAAALTEIEVTAELSKLVETGALAMAEGRLAMVADTPNPFVCRLCGHILLSEPEANCPECNSKPGTFKAFLPVYWLDNYDPFEALQIMRRTPAEVAALMDGLTEEQLGASPEPGEWSIRNAIAHLRDAQELMEFRIGLMIEEDNPVLESQAVFEWAEDEGERPATTEEIYQTYIESRGRVLTQLESLPLKDWQRTGRHMEFGTLTIKQQASYFATHDLTHFPQIESLVAWQKGAAL